MCSDKDYLDRGILIFYKKIEFHEVYQNQYADLSDSSYFNHCINCD